jgi:hypothetical protein
MSAKSPSVSVTPELLYQGDGYLFGAFRNVFIAIWTVQSTALTAEQLGARLGPFALAHPEGGSFIQIIAKSPPLPTPEAREKLIHHMRTYSGQLACIGTVLEGTGFWASALRSFLVGLRIVVPRTFEMQTYASIAPLAAWLPPLHLQRTGVSVTAAEIQTVLTGLRARVE